MLLEALLTSAFLNTSVSWLFFIGFDRIMPAEGWSIANLLYMIYIQFGCPILLQFVNMVVARVNTRN